MRFLRLRLESCIALLLAAPASFADPWVSPGDVTLRHDILVLADRGVIRGPVTTWPLSWPDIARDVLASQDSRSLDAATRASLDRVRRAARVSASASGATLNARTSLAVEPTPFRTFANEPREDAEFTAGLDGTGDRFAMRLQLTGAVDPDDGKGFRPDGSYVGMHVGNFMISAGYVDRWWGPGWEGSLLLSTSARPIPALTIERNHSQAFESPWLSWIGPWRAHVVFGQLESNRTDFDDTRFFAARVTFRPLQQLEIGLSRSAQWCGEGRPCDLQAFGDLLIGADNDQAVTEQPGNQLAGYDLRWAFKSIPLALYGQAIGEDEAGGLPSKFLGLGGLEVWGSGFGGSWRAHAEYAATSCNFSYADPTFDCAYESGIYTQGYRFRGRSIGHAMDSDGRMSSLGAIYIGSAGERWEILARRIELNRNAVIPEPAHTVAPLAAELTNIELVHAREFAAGEARIGIGYDSYKERLDGGDDSVVRGYLQWQRSF